MRTPGPWKTVNVPATVINEQGWIICDSGDWGGGIDQDDARLIAAAPELLAALKEFMDEAGGLEGWVPDSIYGRAAIAINKAEGRS